MSAAALRSAEALTAEGSGRSRVEEILAEAEQHAGISREVSDPSVLALVAGIVIATDQIKAAAP